MNTTEVTATLRDKDDSVFDTTLPYGRTLTFDSGIKGEDAQGVPPTHALLASLAACEGMVAMAFLRKMGQSVHTYRLELEAEASSDDGHDYDNIYIKHIIDGDVEDSRMARTIELLKTYCPIAVMLMGGSVNIANDWEIRQLAAGDEAEDTQAS